MPRAASPGKAPGRSACSPRPGRWKPAKGAIWRSGTSRRRPSWSTASASTRSIGGSGGERRHEPASAQAGRGAARRLARDLSRRRAARSTRPGRPGRAERRGGRPRSSRAASPSTASTPASASWPACASRPATLPRCSATSCSAMPPASASRCRRPVARLMMALKLASLAQGASGIAPATLALLEAMLAKGIIPVVPAQGSVGASGDLAPLAHMTAAMIGRRRALTSDGARMAAAKALAAAGLKPVAARPEGRSGAAQRHAILDAPMHLPGCSTRRGCFRPRWSPERSRPTPPAAPTRRSIRASTRCGAIAARSRRRRRCAR